MCAAKLLFHNFSFRRFEGSLTRGSYAKQNYLSSVRCIVILPGFHRHSTKRLFSFKSLWTGIAQFGVQPFAIVIYFKLFEHLILGIRSGRKPFTMNRFDFKTVAPAFRSRVIITIPFLTHTTKQLMFTEKLWVVANTPSNQFKILYEDQLPDIF